MLEIKNLTKIYKTKGGTDVKALDDVSISFGETGLVFLLGKSGSGKSTLLNLAGGLDEPTSGEIVVMGKSSKDFSGSDFDSYRNTFIGFVFQEYNVLNEFNVADNVALALELQGKTRERDKVMRILNDVDLAGFAKRKPNTLSGGQKQRIAIARALVKDPQIIMADEPTGALDSVTGKQVFDTLKKLSETRLVIVVSHDREFAEIYGDRIVELKDGKIVSDVTKVKDEAANLPGGVKQIGLDTLTVEAGSVDDATMKRIRDFLSQGKGEVLISRGQKEVASFKRANRIDDSGAQERFEDTTADKLSVKRYDGKETKFIKSKMPLGKAFKMGASGLKTKPIRLIFTVLLAVVAFVMFGVLSTFMLYDPAYSVSQAMQEANYPSIAVGKSYQYRYQSIRVDRDGNETVEYESDYDLTAPALFGVRELAEKNAKGHGKYAGVYTLHEKYWDGGNGSNIMLVSGTNTVSVSTDIPYYSVQSVIGFTDCGAQYMQDNGFTLIKGSYPKDKSEVALPEYIAELFINTEGSGIREAGDVVGKKVRLTGFETLQREELTVSGVYDVGDIPADYNELKNPANSSESQRQLVSSLTDLLTHSFHVLLYVTEDFYEAYRYLDYDSRVTLTEDYRGGLDISAYPYEEPDVDTEYRRGFFTENTVAQSEDAFTFYGLDETRKEFSVKDGQVYLSEQDYRSKMAEVYYDFTWQLRNLAVYDQKATELFGPDSDFEELCGMMSHDKEAYLTVKDEMETWYPVLMLRSDLRSRAMQVRNGIQSSPAGNEEKYQTFFALCAKLEALDSDTPTFLTAAEWAELEHLLTDFNNAEYAPFLYSYYGTRLNETVANSGMPEQLEQLDAQAQASGEYGSFWDLCWKVASEYGYEEPEMQQRQAAAQALLKEILDARYEELCGSPMGQESFPLKVKDVDWSLYYADYKGNSGKLEVVGYFSVNGSSDSYGYLYLLPSSFLDAHCVKDDEPQESYYSKNITDYVEPEDAKYNFLITLTDNSQEAISVALTSEVPSVVYTLKNSVYTELSMFLEMITSMQTVFLIVGLVVGLFAALMLLNFISVSISAKKKEIGILRAVGARGSDTFKIFFSEALIIAVICFILASVAAFFVCDLLNNTLADIITMKLLNFGAVNILLIFAISLGVSFLATFFPVYFAARKKPVESIRAL